MASKLLFSIFSKTSYTSTFTKISPILTRCYSYHRGKQGSRNNLFSRISPLGDPSHNLVPVLDQWVQEGKKVDVLELQRIVRDLRRRKRYVHSLQVRLCICLHPSCVYVCYSRIADLLWLTILNYYE